MKEDEKDRPIDRTLALESQAHNLEKEGKFDEAKRLYWQIINGGFPGSFPYERVRMICARRKEWEEAIKVCRRYVDLNASYMGYGIKSKRMQEWSRKYATILDASAVRITATSVLARAVKNASMSAHERRHVSIPEYRMSQVFPHWARGEIVLETIAVPEFQKYYPSEIDMDRSQKDFYEKWKHYWSRGKPLDVRGNISYLFAYTYEVLSLVSTHPEKALNEMRLLQRVYRDESHFPQYLTRWIFDVYLLMSDYMNAIASLESRTGIEKIAPGDRVILSLKYRLGLPITGEDIASMYKIKLRKIVLDNLDFLIDWLDNVIKDFEERNGVDLLALVTEQFAFHESSETYLFPGVPSIHPRIKLDIFNYSALGDFNVVLNQWFRDAENGLRKETGLPGVGEGWISESMLYNIVAKIFTGMGYDVVHHSYPTFLQRQELDIHIPALKLAIEYMGKQHYEPVDFFGGQQGLDKTSTRDEKKRRSCREHGLTVIDFKYDEPIEEAYVRSKIEGYISIARKILDPEPE